MAGKILGVIASVVCGYASGYAACRGIMEMQETREITSKEVHVAEVDGIYPVREIYYDWEEGKNAVVSYRECSPSEYGRFAAVILPRCRKLGFVTSGICSDALEGICVDRKCRERKDLPPEQIEAGFRKYEELCVVLDCKGICEDWKKL
ncbi:MAG: hypothetical protein QME12_04365 [Nanoarchaeota archaeon]|nr:hypothetical protein [Nanoarchaeota archaeon]